MAKPFDERSLGIWLLESGFRHRLESRGLPLPGETTLIAAALYVGRTPALNTWILLACASLGAIFGDNAGYWIGRGFGFPILRITLDGSCGMSDFTGRDVFVIGPR
jgi:membrane protein DedA with SNARE-associated domain